MDESCPVCLGSLVCSGGLSVGACEHPVCLECSLRLRAVCGRRECPICRRDLDTVYLLEKRADGSSVSYAEVRDLPRLRLDRRLGLCYGSDAVRDRCRDMLANRCHECRQEFASFRSLDQHVRREHRLFYCDICVEHLQVRLRALIIV